VSKRAFRVLILELSDTQQVRSLGSYGGRWVVDCLEGRFAWFSHLETRNSQMEKKFHDGFENIPISQQSPSYAHEDFYPNIRRIFIILVTFHVASVCCERSFSSLRRLKKWEELQWARKGCVVCPCFMFTEIWMWEEKTF
jgi:hypothetical protein